MSNLLYNCRVTTLEKKRALKSLRHQLRSKMAEPEDALVASLDRHRFEAMTDPPQDHVVIKYRPPLPQKQKRQEQTDEQFEYMIIGDDLNGEKLSKAKSRRANAFRVRKCYR